jgi:hypothetical protein
MMASYKSSIRPPDLEEMDGGPLREAENRAIRLLLEKDRARERLAQRIRFWVPVMAAGFAGAAAASKVGFIDWLAGVLLSVKQ